MLRFTLGLGPSGEEIAGAMTCHELLIDTLDGLDHGIQALKWRSQSDLEARLHALRQPLRDALDAIERDVAALYAERAAEHDVSAVEWAVGQPGRYLSRRPAVLQEPCDRCGEQAAVVEVAPDGALARALCRQHRSGKASESTAAS